MLIHHTDKSTHVPHVNHLVSLAKWSSVCWRSKCSEFEFFCSHSHSHFQTYEEILNGKVLFCEVIYGASFEQGVP